MAPSHHLVVTITNSDDATATYLHERLGPHRDRFVRLDTDRVAEKPISFTIGPESSEHWSADDLEASRIGAVYYRRPVLARLGDAVPPKALNWVRNELRFAWGAFLASVPGDRWMDYPERLTTAGYKPLQLATARRIGLRVPETLITTDPAEAEAFCEVHDWQVIAKPIGHGEVRDTEGDATHLVYTNALTPDHASSLSRVRYCPVLLQRKIEKLYDIRVTIVGDRVFAIILHSQENESSSVDCRRDDMKGMRYEPTSLPVGLEGKMLSLVRSFGLRFSAMDLVRDRGGVYWFLENNPAGQWAWLEEQTGVPLSAAIADELVRIADA